MTNAEQTNDAAAPDKPAEAVEPEPQSDSEQPARDADSIGVDISAAAANPGTTAARHQQMHQARQSFAGGTRFDGSTSLRDAISGHQYNIHFGQASTKDLTTHELTEEILAEVRETVVLPPGLKELNASVVILRGPAGSGKSTIAVWSLARLGKVFRLGPGTHLRKLAVEGLTQSAGYLLNDLTTDIAASLTCFDLERLDTEFSKLGGRLVITVRPEIVFTDSEITRYAIDLDVRPDIREVFTKHLRWRLRTERSTLIDELLGRPDVQQLIDVELTAKEPLRKAAELARLFTENRHDPDALAPTVQRLLSRSHEIDFTSWFDGLDDLHLQCFAISLAIFNGLPYETVADAGMLLHRKFDLAGGTAVATRAVPEAASPFGDSRASRLHKLRAKVVPGSEVHTTYGIVPAESVHYTDTSFPVLVVQHVWQEHDRARAGLISWLRDLGGHENQTVRIRAATAVGVLTTTAYDHMRHQVLVPWACSKVEFRRESAAIALVEPADNQDAGLARAVRNLVEDWSFGSRELKATAARSYGIGIGVKSVDTALTALEKLSEDEDFDVIDAVCRSLADLIDAGGPDVGIRVLNMLHTWSGSRRELRRTVGSLAFMLIAADLVTHRPNGTTWPSLLWFGYSHRDQHTLISQLWASSLNAARSASLALTVLDEWAKLVESDATARETLVGLMRSACVNGRVAVRLRRHITTWLKPDSNINAKVIASDLLNTLPQEGHDQ